MLYNSLDNNITGTDNCVKMSKHDDLMDCSSQSIVCAMNRFVKTVNIMNETVMVSYRLLNMDVSDEKENVPLLIKDLGPFTCYSLLNNVKNDLMWGPSSNEEEEDVCSSSASTSSQASGQSATSSTIIDTLSHSKSPLRRQSALSMVSVLSAASDGESENSAEVYNGLEVDNTNCDASVTVASFMSQLRSHLVGFHECLDHLTDTAAYITERYQEEMNS